MTVWTRDGTCGDDVGMVPAPTCANPECPTKPSFPEETDKTPYQNRQPCPACGSRARAFGRAITESAGLTDTIQVVVTRSTSWAVAAPVQPKLTLSGIGLEVTHGVKVLIADLEDSPDSPCVAQVQDLHGNLLVMGVGESAADAIAQLFEHMLPPDSGEYLPPDDGMPGHDC